MKKQFLILFAFISVLALSQVPQRFNKVIVTGDIVSPKFIKTGSNADSVLLGNGSARSVNSLKTDTVNLSNRINAKAEGTGTANGTNTGDETLTSIKTKLGAATSVSDGYLKYQDWSIFNSKEPAITKKTAFNKNFGTTTGTVLEGRTFGTAANSAVGDFQPAITSLTTNYIPKWNGSSFVNSLISDDGNKIYPSRVIQMTSNNQVEWGSSNNSMIYGNSNGVLNMLGDVKVLNTTPSTSPTTGALVTPGGIGANHVRANNFYGNGSNLTGVQLPITLTTNGTSGAATFSGNVLNVPNYASTGIGGSYTASISSGSNTANPVVYSSLYTKNGTVYSSIIKGYIECTGSQGNTCTFNVSTYNGSTSNLSIIGVGAQGTNIILGSGSTGSNVVMSFANPVGSGGIGFTLIIHYTN